MGKMPKGLREYWAKKRGKKTGKSGGRKMGNKGGRKSRNVPVMGMITLGALLAGIFGQGNKGIEYAGSPIGYLSEKQYAKAGTAALNNLTRPSTYMMVAIPLVAWGGMKVLGVSSRKVAKGVTLG